MFEAVQNWVHSRPDRGQNLNDILSSEGVRAGRNTGGVPHTHGGGQSGFAALGGSAHGQAHGHGQPHAAGGFQSFLPHGQSHQGQGQSHHGSSGLPWEKLSSLPIPGMSNLNKLESTISHFIPGGLSHGSSRGVEEEESRSQDNAPYQAQHPQHAYPQGPHEYQGQPGGYGY